MKTKKPQRRLTLNKATISNLSEIEMKNSHGGASVLTNECTNGDICTALRICTVYFCTNADADRLAAVRTYNCGNILEAMRTYTCDGVY